MKSNFADRQSQKKSRNQKIKIRAKTKFGFAILKINFVSQRCRKKIKPRGARVEV
jgi:hypothetical protein